MVEIKQEIYKIPPHVKGGENSITSTISSGCPGVEGKDIKYECGEGVGGCPKTPVARSYCGKVGCTYHSRQTTTLGACGNRLGIV